jgi:hypothetical protein
MDLSRTLTATGNLLLQANNNAIGRAVAAI